MSVEFYRGSPGKFDSRTLNRKTLNRWTGRNNYDNNSNSNSSSNSNSKVERTLCQLLIVLAYHYYCSVIIVAIIVIQAVVCVPS